MKQLVGELDEEKKIRLSLQVRRNQPPVELCSYTNKTCCVFILSTKNPLSVKSKLYVRATLWGNLKSIGSWLNLSRTWKLLRCRTFPCVCVCHCFPALFVSDGRREHKESSLQINAHDSKGGWWQIAETLRLADGFVPNKDKEKKQVNTTATRKQKNASSLYNYFIWYFSMVLRRNRLLLVLRLDSDS